MRTVRENLERLKMSQLIDTAFRLNVDHPQGRDTKALWLPLVIHAVEALQPETLRLTLLDTEWEALMDGMLATEEMGGIGMNLMSRLKTSMPMAFAYEHLRRMGLAWQEGRFFFLAKKALDAARLETPEDSAAFEQNLLMVIDGLMRVVGGMPAARISRSLYVPGHEEVEVEPLTEHGQIRIIELWRMRTGMEGIHLVNGETWLTTEGCDDTEKLALAQLVGPGRSLDYPRISVGEATRISISRNPVAEDACEPVLHMMWQAGADRQEAHECLAKAVLLTQQSRQEEAVELLSDMMDRSPNPSRMLKLNAFFEAVPEWGLRGHTEAEMNTAHRLPPIGPRADGLCSCGSGRLYTRCCGRMN